MKISKKLSQGEELFSLQLKSHNIPFIREHKFHPTRKWRIDFLVQGFAIEIEGGTWNRGDHIRGKRFEADCEKYNEITLMYYRLLRFTTSQVKSGFAIDTLLRGLK